MTFIKTTTEWDGMYCCKYAVPADGIPETDRDEVLSYIDGHLDFLTGFIVSGISASTHMDSYRLLRDVKKKGLSVMADKAPTDVLEDLIGAGVIDWCRIEISSEKAPAEKELSSMLALFEKENIKFVARVVLSPGSTDSVGMERIARACRRCKAIELMVPTRGLPAGVKPLTPSEIRKLSAAAGRHVHKVSVLTC